MAFTTHLLAGAEEGGLERLDGSTGSPSVSTAVRSNCHGRYCYSGVTASLKFDPFAYHGSNQGTGHIVGFWFKGFYGSANAGILTVKDVNDVDQMIRLIAASNEDSIYVYQSDDSFVGTASTGTARDPNQWYNLELYWEATASGAWEIFLNGHSIGSGTGNFSSNGTDVGWINVFTKGASEDSNDSYIDDIYYGSGATSAADRLSNGTGGLDIIPTIGTGSPTTGGDALDVGTWPNVQEVPKNDTNLARYNRDDSTIDERIAPDAILTQTNLTGSLTDIDDDPDSPDGLWLDATGKAVLRTSFGTPGYDFLGNGDIQELRVLLRKSAADVAAGTTRYAPDTLAVQTNLTGAVTDIDDDPDSPDANWLTASGSSTCRVTFPTPTYDPKTGAGLQEFRVLMRKDATGPAGGGTEEVTPDSLLTQTNLSGALSTITGDPDSPDATWMTTTGSGSTLNVSTTNPTNGANIDIGTDAQTIKLYVRKDASGGGTPIMTVEVHDSGGLHETLVTDDTVTSSTGELKTYTWTASGISGPNDVEIHISCSKGGGGPNERNVEFDAVRWEMVYTGAETQPGYEIKLYENGSEVVAAGSATGNLTDAGGDTVVAFTWDATNLGTADGSLVECYINQTSGADRYIEIGAVEWNEDHDGDVENVAYKLSLWENGSEIVGAGSTTGTLTDAGGDTVVSLLFSKLDLTNQTGLNVECQVEQTDASPTRFMDVGAVEFNCDQGTWGTARSGWVQADDGSWTGLSGLTNLNLLDYSSYYWRYRLENDIGANQIDLLAGNSVDGANTLESKFNVIDDTWLEHFELSSSVNIQPTITEYSRMGFGVPAQKWADVVLGEAIAMHGHLLPPHSRGTIDQTLPSLTQDVTGTFVGDIDRSGSIDQTLPSMSQSLTGTFLKTYSGSVTQTLGSLVSSMTGTHVPPAFTGPIDQTLPTVISIALGTFVPWSATGTIDQLLPQVMSSATGETSPPVFSGSLAQTLPSLTQVLTGTHLKTFSGSINQSIGGAIPYGGTNLFNPSRDLTGWQRFQAPGVSYNQIGMQGLANTATLVTDADSSTFGWDYIHDNYFAGASDTDRFSLRVFLKKDSNNTIFPEISLYFEDSISGFGGTGLSLQINTSTGAGAVRVDSSGTDSNWSIATYPYNSDWWEIKIDVVNPGDSYVKYAVRPAASNDLGVASSYLYTRSVIIDNTELYRDTAISDISGGPVYLPNPISGSLNLISAMTGTHVPPAFTGPIDQTLPSLVSAATGTHVPPAFTGPIDQTLPSLVQALTGTASAPTFDASIDQILPSLTQALTGTHLKTYSGSINQVFGGLPAYGGTNLLPNSNTLTGWTNVGSPILTGSQPGIIPGIDNATYVEDNSTGFEYRHEWVYIGINTKKYTLRYFIEKQDAGDSNNPAYHNVGLGFIAAPPSFWSGGSLSAWQFNSITGAVLKRYGRAADTILVRTYAGNSDWWEILIDGTNPGGTYDYVGALCAPAYSNQWDTASDATAQGWFVWGNAELYEDTSKEDVSGGPVYTPTPVSGSSLPLISSMTGTFTGVGARIGSIDQTLPAVSQALTGTFAPGTSTGSIDQTLPSLIQALTGTFLKTYIASIDQTLPILVQALTGTFVELGASSGTIDQTLPAVSQSLTGTFAAGTSTGSIDQTLPSLIQALTGTFAAGTKTGAIDQTLPSLIQALTGTNVPGVSTGTIDQTLSSLIQTLTGTYAPPDSSGSIDQTLPILTQAVTADFTPVGAKVGSIDQILPSLIQSATGTFAPGASAGQITQVLPALVQAVSGTFGAGSKAGSIVQVLPSLISVMTGSTGVPSFPGAIDQTLPAPIQTLTGVSTVPVFAGSIVQTLPSLAQTLTGTFAKTYTGSITQTLPMLTQVLWDVLPDALAEYLIWIVEEENFIWIPEEEVLVYEVPTDDLIYIISTGE